MKEVLLSDLTIQKLVNCAHVPSLNKFYGITDQGVAVFGVFERQINLLGGPDTFSYVALWESDDPSSKEHIEDIIELIYNPL